MNYKVIVGMFSRSGYQNVLREISSDFERNLKHRRRRKCKQRNLLSFPTLAAESVSVIFEMVQNRVASSLLFLIVTDPKWKLHAKRK